MTNAHGDGFLPDRQVNRRLHLIIEVLLTNLLLGPTGQDQLAIQRKQSSLFDHPVALLREVRPDAGSNVVDIVIREVLVDSKMESRKPDPFGDREIPFPITEERERPMLSGQRPEERLALYAAALQMAV